MDDKTMNLWRQIEEYRRQGRKRKHPGSAREIAASEALIDALRQAAADRFGDKRTDLRLGQFGEGR